MVGRRLFFLKYKAIDLEIALNSYQLDISDIMPSIHKAVYVLTW